ncbi:hypothetical protein NQ315_013071 [Exocentrus adspersus]|uniref:Elongation of very long chain fatty acids protein n=1 Tax=Exocentrus adspersus TaxID=1586481 RepID=A0AAV8VY29_9CUCU|nr:hypothetical protein NQ315_013071 [Exocentrus adspersus]
MTLYSTSLQVPIIYKIRISMEFFADSRTNNWFLIRHPFHGLGILALYLYFVNSWGPKFMKNREPWKLTKLLIIYNFLQVLVSGYIFTQGLDAAWLHYDWTCEPCDHSNTPEALRVARLVYVYFLDKMVDLLDTVFFVLRKKDKQITFLHCYHHTMMVIVGWICVKYYPGGHCTFIGLINSFIHVIMYSYYLLAALGPQVQKYLWWKRYLTTMQLAQFCIMFVHTSLLMFKDCGYPKWPVLVALPNIVFFYYLFVDFYNMAYKKEGTNTQRAPLLENKSPDDNSNISETTQNIIDGMKLPEAHSKNSSEGENGACLLKKYHPVDS